MIRLGIAVLALCGSLILVGCGGGSSGLSASSTCTDCGNASPEEQAEAISKLATQFRTPDLTTPLGEPNVAYVCAGEPETTLEAVFENAHKGEVEQEGAETAAAPELEGVSEVEKLVGGLPQEQMTIGQQNAPVTLIEFADLQCPICKEFAEEMVPKLIAGPVAEGKARIEYRNFVIIGPQSVPAATAALAAGKQGRGWSFVEIFYRNQGEERSGYITSAFLKEIAEAAGVEDLPRWSDERESAALTQEVEATTKEAGHLGFDGTPSFAVEGPDTGGLELLGTPENLVLLEEAIEAAE